MMARRYPYCINTLLLNQSWKAQAEKYCLGLQQCGLTASVAPDNKFEVSCLYISKNETKELFLFALPFFSPICTILIALRYVSRCRNSQTLTILLSITLCRIMQEIRRIMRGGMDESGGLLLPQTT